MLIEKYCDNEDWRAGYREACFDLCVGNLDRDKAFELQREDEDCEDCEDCCGECDVYDIAYKHGYSAGLEDGYKDALEEDEEYELPEEIVLDATNFNTIEELKSNIRTTINALHKTNTPAEIISQLWDVVGGLVELEKSIAGNEVLEYYINR